MRVPVGPKQPFTPAVILRGLPGGGVDAVFDPIGGTLVGYGQSQVLRDGKVHNAAGPSGLFGGIGGLKLLPDGRKTSFCNTFSLEKKVPEAYREDRVANAHELSERSSVTGMIVLTCADRRQGAVTSVPAAWDDPMRPGDPPLTKFTPPVARNHSIWGKSIGLPGDER